MLRGAHQGRLFAGVMAAGVEPVGLLPGSLHLLLARRPIERATDLQGLEVGLVASEVGERALRMLGASPVPLARGESMGALDAVAASLGDLAGRYIGEARYLVTDAPFGAAPRLILANRETWANLSQDERHDRRPVPGAVPAHLPLAHAANREIGRWSNPSIYAGILAVLTLQLAFVALAPMHDIFDSALPDVAALLLALLGSLLVFPVTWLEERWRVRRLTAPATADTGADDR